MSIPGELTTALLALPITALTGFVSYKAGLRREDTVRYRDLRAKAGAELSAALRKVREIVRRSRFEQLSPHDVSDALLEFQSVWDEHSHRLPDGWLHLSKSMNAALGEHFGPVGWSNHFRDARDSPLSSVDAIWT